MLPALLALFLALFAITSVANAQVAGAPGFVDYQGTVFDGTTGAPLGSAGTDPDYTADPKNYSMEFKVYDSASEGAVVWAETQTVTVSLGNFSVRLGSGVAILGLSPAASETSIINAFSGKDRFLELTVIIPPAVTGTPITPRLAFQASPFSFVAERAKLADEVIGKVTATAASTFAGGTFTGGVYGTSGSPANVTGTLTGSVVGSVSGTATNVTGVVGIANGGTGSTSKNFVDMTSTQSGIAGNKSFSDGIAIGRSAAPTDKLQVYGSTSNIRITNTSETYSGVIMEDAEGLNQYGAVKFNSGDNKLGLFVMSETPKVTVDASGELKFGPTANLHAIGNGAGSMRMVFGYIYNGGLGNMTIGSSSGDFTIARINVGTYRIAFTAGTFTNYPIVTGNSYGDQLDNLISIRGVTNTWIIIECRDSMTRILEDSSFMFTALGAR